MFNIIPPIIIILCIGGILVILSRRLPKVAEQEEATLEEKIAKFREKKKRALAKRVQKKSLEAKEKIFVQAGKFWERINKSISKIQKKIQDFKARKEEEKWIRQIASDPKNIEAYKNLGQLYIKINNLRDARACFKHILKIDPTDGEAKEDLEKLKTKKLKPR